MPTSTGWTRFCQFIDRCSFFSRDLGVFGGLRRREWRPESVEEFRKAAALADRHYRVGAVPIATYVELQKQYLVLETRIIEASELMLLQLDTSHLPLPRESAFDKKSGEIGEGECDGYQHGGGPKRYLGDGGTVAFFRIAIERLSS